MNQPQSFWDTPEEQQAHEEAVKRATQESQTKAVGQTRSDPVAEVRRGIKQMEEEFSKVLPSHIRPEQFARIVITSLQRNPDLLSLDRTSLFAACMLAAQDGLCPDGKEAALVPRKGKVHYSPMVWGIMKKVRQSGELSTLMVNMVFKNDKFRYWVDDNGEHVEHEPPPFATDRGPKIGGFAMMMFKDGGRQIELMSMAQIKDVENVSEAKRGPWAGPFKEEMEKKSIIRRLTKRCHMSQEVERVVQRDDVLYDFKTPATESGLAKELNGGEKSKDSSGDQIGSLSDLSVASDRPVPHQNVQSEPDRRGMEPGSDVQGAPQRTTPHRLETDDGSAPNPGGDAPGEGVGNKSAPVHERRRAPNPRALAKAP